MASCDGCQPQTASIQKPKASLPMTTDASPDQPLKELPLDISKRLLFWHGLWKSSAKYHYFFGVVSVAASVISTSLEGGQAKVFSIIAATATALIGFMHPERRYTKFVRAWRVLDVAAMRYRHGIIDKPALIDAVERGEALIAEFEDKYDGSTVESKESDKAMDARPTPPEPGAESSDSQPAPPPSAPTLSRATDAEASGSAPVGTSVP
jgi:hypothetical protein